MDDLIISCYNSFVLGVLSGPEPAGFLLLEKYAEIKRGESYENAMIEKYGEDTSNHPIVDSDLWIKAACENKKVNSLQGMRKSLQKQMVFLDIRRFHGGTDNVKFL
ncbi:unnamed protein product [Sphenostylis stenocarpa]|uniref:Uncharacterized protein n=1 Tax=Sphenostylis stenocarpa TaxID=92480 RepID=A0AA86T6G0_9FABA|nr:unnamed protein product [Sphenostylis stenocarpa]